MKTFKEFSENYVAPNRSSGQYPDTPKVKSNEVGSLAHYKNYVAKYNHPSIHSDKAFDDYSNEYNLRPDTRTKLKDSLKESIDEAYGDKKEPFVPKVGANVRIPTEKLGQTIGGKVQRQGRSGLWHIKAADGEVHALPEKHVFHPDLSCKNYHEYSWGGNHAMKEAVEKEKPKLETYRVNNDHHGLGINVDAYSAKEAQDHVSTLNPKFKHTATTSKKLGK